MQCNSNDVGKGNGPVQAPKYKLKIRDFALTVNLGCTAPERATKQEVRIGVDLWFDHEPKAVQSDKLSETICYEQLCLQLKNSVTKQSFHTIEHVYSCVRNELELRMPQGSQYRVSIHKVSPPIEGLCGGVKFEDEGYSG